VKDWILEIWGDYACFTRPEMKVERVSYDIITPSAARGILEAIFWKPAIKWHISQIEILNPIRFTSIRRNELGNIITLPSKAQMEGPYEDAMGINIEENRQQRASLILRDVRYRVHAWFEYICPEDREDGRISDDESPGKYAAMFERRARNGQCFHRPYLGCREFACYFRLVEDKDDSVIQPIQEDRDLGWMLYDMDFSNPKDIQAQFFHAVMQQGIVNSDRRVVEVRQ